MILYLSENIFFENNWKFYTQINHLEKFKKPFNLSSNKMFFPLFLCDRREIW